jgi:hypothetical protein
MGCESVATMTWAHTKSSHARFMATSIAFVVCQVFGAMCVSADIASARQITMLIADNMPCPMDGTVMCPPSAISSPERQLKSGVAIDLDDVSIPLSLVTSLGRTVTSTPWSWSSVLSIVPISIASSSVLRI